MLSFSSDQRVMDRVYFAIYFQECQQEDGFVIDSNSSNLDLIA